MKPLVVHVIHHLYIGGMENGLVNLLNRLPQDQFDHAVVCIEDASDFQARIERDDIEIYSMYRSRHGQWGLRWQLFQLFRRLKPTIVHTRGISGLDALAPALLAGVKVRVHGEHGRDVDDLDGTALKPALLRLLHAPLVSHYVAVSKDLASYLVDRVRVSERRISQIYNGVDTQRFSIDRQSARLAMPPGFADPDLFVVGTVGRLQAVKNQATLIRAFAELSARTQEADRCRLVIVGDGPKREELAALVAELGISERVLLAGASDEVPRFLAAMDLFVLPSLAEGISNTLLEAMSCGVAVAASAVGGNVEILEPGQSGTLFAPTDVDELTNILQSYVLDRERTARLGEAARARAVAAHDLGGMVDEYRELYLRYSG